MEHLCSLGANNKKMTMLRESQIMKIHYITAVAALFVVAVHIMMRIAIMPYGMSLEYGNVIANYQSIKRVPWRVATDDKLLPPVDPVFDP